MKLDLIQSALNYTGSKYRLLPQILPLFPKQFNQFIDLFAGGAVVSANIAKQQIETNSINFILINDLESHIINLYHYFSKINFETLIFKLELLISRYGLSDTYHNGYQYYSVDSSRGLGKINKEAYLKLRTDYNVGKLASDEQQLAFYLLIVFGFNNQIRFNSKGEYNLPVGKRDFNAKMRNKLFEFHSILHDFPFEFSNDDFREVKNVKANDFVYVDPPYRIATATYNENGGWGVTDDLELFAYLDKINKKGAKFALSNVVIHNNIENYELVKWMSKYNLNIMNYNYNNSNYQSKAKDSSTVEVLITNY